MSKERSSFLPNSVNGDDRDSHFVEDRTTKKERFKGGLDEASIDMVVDPNLSLAPSWKDKLLGGVPAPSMMDQNVSSSGKDSESDGDFDLLVDDVQTSIVNGVSDIIFLTGLRKFWRSIGYKTLHNRKTSLWKPISAFHLIDIKNGYYLGPWIIFGQYLTVQPWTKDFSPLQPYPSVVVKLDFQTENRTRGHFTRLSVFKNLEKPLVSQVLVDGAVQRIKYKAFPTVCFGYDKYRHVKNLCPTVAKDWTPKCLSKAANVFSATANEGAVEQMGFKPSSGIGSSKEATAVAKEMDDMGRPIVRLAVEPATLNSSGQAANERHGKAMEKRPMLGSVIT
ncbi:hypothetical protein GOBAR_AA04159 [Gossypium barbadense]|uniref:DUF4283 domain-containing protein n=1 Tax=Gossypium barbadense TaxID=3634 RepID=A0A2P5YLE9_GOSBA|nr:hypothetical protein GOBAR_AA04159 [Gossypium barbadense]